MHQLVFEVVDGRAMPRLPREPDGKRYVSLEQASAVTGKSAAELRELYDCTFKDLLKVPGEEKSDADDSLDGDEIYVSVDGATPASSTANDATIDLDPAVDGGVSINPAALKDARRRLAHALHFPHLSDEQFDQVEAFARERRFDLLSRHLWADTRHDPATNLPRLFIGLTIEGFRTVAHRTGQYVGCDRTEYTFDDRDEDTDPLHNQRGPRRPATAIATVFRTVNGVDKRFVGEAVWEDLAGAPGTGDVLTFREQAPRTWLAKCAKAAALREAFPNELGGIYAPEEMARTMLQMSRPSKPKREKTEWPGPRAEDFVQQLDPERGLPATACDENVCSPRTFDLALIERGISSVNERLRILRLARQRLPDLAKMGDPAKFYGHAINDIRNYPQAYGLPSQEA